MAIFGERKRGGKHCPDKLYFFKVGGRTKSLVTEAVRFNLQGDGKAKITLPSDNGGDDCSFRVTIPEKTAPLNLSFDVPLDNSTYECNDSPVYVCVYGQTCVERSGKLCLFLFILPLHEKSHKVIVNFVWLCAVFHKDIHNVN